MAYEHENTIYGGYGEFEPVAESDDTPEFWADHEAEADAFFAARDREDSEFIFVGEPDEPVYDEPDYFYSDVEMGMYDDDPNPYHGDYSEM